MKSKEKIKTKTK